MPLYEYQCDDCGERFERIRKFSDPPLEEPCPKCGGPIRKLLSSPAIQFKGKGWYVTDYAKSGASEASKTESSSEATSKDKSADTKTSTTETKTETKSEPAKTTSTATTDKK
jgi:putative FmdB family regulatory protein